MPINAITGFCSSCYENSNTKYRCSDCENECHGSCDTCLDKIHYGDLRRYNCSNIANYYVCQYTYKYASEIEVLVQSVPQLLTLERFDVLSIGCGPCTDFLGILNFVQKNRLQKPVFYAGYDLNEIWTPIQNQIGQIVNDTQFTLRFSHRDVFKVVDRLNLKPESWVPNILSLQYVISDMVKYKSQEEIHQFINSLFDKIISHMPNNSFILLNDINHNTRARNYFEYMFNVILTNHRNSVCTRFHFENNQKQWAYGTQHARNSLTIQIPRHIRENYNPWTYCTSAQMAIHIRK